LGHLLPRHHLAGAWKGTRDENGGRHTERAQNREPLPQHRPVGVVEGDDEGLAGGGFVDRGGKGPWAVADPEEISDLALESPRRERVIGRPGVADGVMAENQEVIGAADMPYATEP
jgi:hypothetical protein